MNKISTPAEACAALAVLVAGADDIGTLEEGRFLFATIADLPMFSHLDQDGFGRLMADTAEWIWASYAPDNQLTDAGVSELLDLISGAVPPELRQATVAAAVGLAKADGMVEPEKLLLRRVCEGLEVDPGSFLA